MNPNIACGIDIEERSRFEKHIPDQSYVSDFCRMVYTEREIDNNICFDPQLTFPLAFSCKEAIFKALGKSWTNSPISWKDIEVLFTNKNNIHEHTILLSDYALEVFNEKKFQKIETSLNFSKDIIIFEVIFLQCS